MAKYEKNENVDSISASSMAKIVTEASKQENKKDDVKVDVEVPVEVQVQPVSLSNSQNVVSTSNTASVTNTSSSKKSTGLIVLEGLLERYTNIRKQSLLNSKVKTQAIKTFQEIVRAAINYPEKEVYDTILKFFKNNRDKVFAPQYALQGIEQQHSLMRQKIELFYGIFDKLSTDDLDFDMDYVRKVFGDTSYIVRYISNKKK